MSLADPFGTDATPLGQQPQPFTGGSNIVPMPVQSGKSGNPFTDVLNHVDAFNTALSGSGVRVPPVTRPFLSGINVQQPDPDPGPPARTSPAAPPPVTPPPTLTIAPPPPATPPPDPRTRPSAPPQQWSATNPMPKPSDEDMKNSEIAANYYRSFAYENPAFANITAADVEAYRAYPQGMTIGQWYLAGHRAGEAPPAPPILPTITPTAPPSYPPVAPPQSGPPPATPPPATPPPAAPPATPPPSVPPATPPPSLPPSPPPPVLPPDIQSLIDMFTKEAGANNGPDMEKLLNPMFARQRQKLDETLRASAALTPGRLESGGFGMNEGQALSDLSGVQSGKLADSLQAQHLAQMQQNTALMGLATQAGMQKYITDMDADLKKFEVNSNSDLQKWIDSQDNALKKYGIDTQDLFARYQAELQLRGIKYSADRGVESAALQAAAAHAAASAAAAASLANGQLQYQLGMQGLNVDREKNIGTFILGLLGNGNLNLNALNGILNGILPGYTIAKP